VAPALADVRTIVAALGDESASYCAFSPEIIMNSTKSDWRIAGALIALSLVPAIAGTARLAQLAGGATITPENARFFAAPLPVLLHILSVTVFSMLGAFSSRQGSDVGGTGGTALPTGS